MMELTLQCADASAGDEVIASLGVGLMILKAFSGFPQRSSRST
jgi:hypothetical protein